MDNFQETVVKDYESRLSSVQNENVEIRKLLFSHVFQLATILKEDPECASVTMLPLDVSQDSIETLSDNLLESVEQIMSSKAKAVKMNQSVRAYEERLTFKQQGEDTDNKDDNFFVLKELKEMFEDGKELLRVNHKVLEEEKREVAKMRQDLQHEKQELEKVRKLMLAADFLGGDSQSTMWNIDSGPSWSQGHATLTIPTNVKICGASAEQPYQINSMVIGGSGRHGGGGASRPPSRPGSKPGSRSQSIARESKGKSPGAFAGQVRVYIPTHMYYMKQSFLDKPKTIV